MPLGFAAGDGSATQWVRAVCNLYSITTNQAAIAALFRVNNRYVGNLPPMPGVFPDYPAPVVRNVDAERELTVMRWGMPPPIGSYHVPLGGFVFNLTIEPFGQRRDAHLSREYPGSQRWRNAASLM